MGSPEADKPQHPAMGPSAPESAAAHAPAPAPAVESADSFKFKIKDVLEAEMKSSSRLLIWSLLLIFVVFSVLIVVATKAVAKRPKGPWIVALVGMLLATVLAFIVIQRITKSPIESSTIEKLYDLKPSAASPEAFQPLTPALVEQMRRQLDGMLAELREQHRISTIQPNAASLRLVSVDSDRVGLWYIAGGIFVAVLMLALGAGASLLAMGVLGPFARRRLAIKRRTGRPDAVSDPIPNQSLPLNAIYRLEDLLSEHRINAEKIERLLESDKPPAIADPEELLHALNSVRRQLEGGLGINEKLAKETPVVDAGYRFKSAVGSFTFYELNIALDALDEALSGRYELPSEQWRLMVLAALAKARRSLIAVCEPKELDTSTTRL